LDYHHITFVVKRGGSKVSQQTIARFINQNIVSIEIAMHDAFGMKVCGSRGNANRNA
jgi:hypothetical protein